MQIDDRCTCSVMNRGQWLACWVSCGLSTCATTSSQRMWMGLSVSARPPSCLHSRRRLCLSGSLPHRSYLYIHIPLYTQCHVHVHVHVQCADMNATAQHILYETWCMSQGLICHMCILAISWYPPIVGWIGDYSTDDAVLASAQCWHRENSFITIQPFWWLIIS